MHADLTITATDHTPGDDAGMRLGEIEAALAQARTSGAHDSTRVKVTTNPNRRVRTLVVQIRPEDRNRDEHGRFAPDEPADEQPEPVADPPAGDADEEPVNIGRRRVRDNPQA